MARREPVLIERFFIALTGVLSVVSGAYLLGIATWRIWNPLPTPIPLSRTLSFVLTMGFIVSVLFTGICFIMIALSGRIWDRT